MITKALLAAAAALAAGASALAASEPAVYADARLGSLRVVSGVVLTAKTADMRGVWLDSKVPCTVNRRLTVRAEIHYVPFQGSRRRIVRQGVFRDPNCAEGGPNVGFTISGRSVGLACPDGTWKPARYNFLTATTEPTRRLKATASLLWEKRGRC